MLLQERILYCAISRDHGWTCCEGGEVIAVYSQHLPFKVLSQKEGPLCALSGLSDGGGHPGLCKEESYL